MAFDHPSTTDKRSEGMSQKLFEDLGFSPAEAAALKLKADLNTKIVKAAARYTQQELQHKLGTSQPRVSDLLRGKMAKFSLDTLVLYAELLGLRTEIKTTEAKKQSRTRGAAVGVPLAR